MPRPGRASLALALLYIACARPEERPPPLAAAAVCPQVAPAEVVGTVTREDLDELSGLVASRRHPGVLWTHNDSGARPTLTALRPTGEVIADLELAGAAAIDWEDLALGPGPEPGVDYLYVGDIGDNRRRRLEVVVYRLPEPDPHALAAGAAPVLAEALVLRYPGEPENAEALLVDPATGDLYLITKGERAHLYRADAGALKHEATLDLGVGALATAADISPAGDRLVVRTYNRAYLWPRAPGQPLAAALVAPPCDLPVAVEPQGEAIAFAADGAALYTVSESREAGRPAAPIYRLVLAPSAAQK